METVSVKIPKQLLNSVKAVVEKTKLFADEDDFISQAIIKQISKYK
jgi:Arc/MetJ-type ribon-helix-helix transcriptional regulator